MGTEGEDSGDGWLARDEKGIGRVDGNGGSVGEVGNLVEIGQRSRWALIRNAKGLAGGLIDGSELNALAWRKARQERKIRNRQTYSHLPMCLSIQALE